MKQIKIAWKIDSKDDDTPINYTYLSFDDFNHVNSIDDVHSKIEEILQQDFEADIDYIVYDFNDISNKIFYKIFSNSSYQMKNCNSSKSEIYRSNSSKLQTSSSPVSEINTSTITSGCLVWSFIIFFVLWIFSLLNLSYKESCTQMDNDLTYPTSTPDRSYLQKFDKYVAECAK